MDGMGFCSSRRSGSRRIATFGTLFFLSRSTTSKLPRSRYVRDSGRETFGKTDDRRGLLVAWEVEASLVSRRSVCAVADKGDVRWNLELELGLGSKWACNCVIACLVVDPQLSFHWTCHGPGDAMARGRWVIAGDGLCNCSKQPRRRTVVNEQFPGSGQFETDSRSTGPRADGWENGTANVKLRETVHSKVSP
ncbi:hypothetical protein B0H65DRAFT_171024 [Neurospora tetraspora]|uniref:Uncharacterized protein n=1 Tax=Neurospora tetraspora TaxID=94610 RepID=A0AAE0JI29_9PEZI|nr:hypothetical protein B0H65DRAFT_171024 [Neurospora tetraspora]